MNIGKILRHIEDNDYIDVLDDINIIETIDPPSSFDYSIIELEQAIENTTCIEELLELKEQLNDILDLRKLELSS